MLSLSRYVGERILIGEPGKRLGAIEVVSIHGDKVRLAFDFPREIQIDREEVAESKAAGPRPPQTAPPRRSGESLMTRSHAPVLPADR